MRSTLLPTEIDESSVFALLGQYHIKGKKDWLPFEQAGFLYRRHTKQLVDIESLAEELGIKLAEAKNLVGTYAFMTDRGIKNPTKWSYYYEYFKSRKIKKNRIEYTEFDDLMVDKIQNGVVGKALDFRDGIKLLGDADSKTVKKFVNGKYSFSDAIHAVEDSGNGNEIYKRLSRFRAWINKDETNQIIQSASKEEKRKIEFELEKIYKILKRRQIKCPLIKGC